MDADPVADRRGRGGDGGGEGGDRHPAPVRRGAEPFARDELAGDGVLVGRPRDRDLRGVQLAHECWPARGPPPRSRRRPRSGTSPRVRVDSPDRPIEISSSTARALSACRSRGARGGFVVLELVVVLLGADLLDVAAHRRADLGGVLDLDAAGPLDREAAAGRCAASTGSRTGSPGRSSGRPRGRRRAARPAGRRAPRRPGWCGRRGSRTSARWSVNSCRSSVSHSPDSAPPSVSGAGSPSEQDRCSSHSSCRGVAGAPSIPGDAMSSSVAPDAAGQPRHLTVGQRAGQATERLVQALAGRDLDADVDLLVRHAPAGEVSLVRQQVVAPPRQRRRRVRVVVGRPAADRVRPGRDAQVDAAPEPAGRRRRRRRR